MASIVPVERIQSRILLIRDCKVLLDSDLAVLYGVATKRLNEQVRRNRKRFPPDFMFRLTAKEVRLLRSQNATSNDGRGGRRYRPLVFTEQGVAMLSSVLHSERAIQVNIAIMRAFARFREIAATHRDIARKLDDLESRCDAKFKIVFDALRAILEPRARPKERIGFHPRRETAPSGLVLPRHRPSSRPKTTSPKEIFS